MSEQLKQVALRIKELREIAGISAASLAKELSIAEELYLQYESGNADIPVSFLYEIAGKFKVELTAILTGEDPKLRTYSVVRQGKGISVDRRKQYKYHSLAYNFLHKRAEPFLVRVEPDGSETVTDFNAHPGQEFNYVLEGDMKIVIDGHEIVLNEGDSIYFDSGCPHGMKALHGKDALFLAIIL